MKKALINWSLMLVAPFLLFIGILLYHHWHADNSPTDKDALAYCASAHLTNADDIRLVTRVVRGLKESGVWTNLDFYYLDLQRDRPINLRDPGKYAIHWVSPGLNSKELSALSNAVKADDERLKAKTATNSPWTSNELEQIRIFTNEMHKIGIHIEDPDIRPLLRDRHDSSLDWELNPPSRQ